MYHRSGSSSPNPSRLNDVDETLPPFAAAKRQPSWLADHAASNSDAAALSASPTFSAISAGGGSLSAVRRSVSSTASSSGFAHDFFGGASASSAAALPSALNPAGLSFAPRFSSGSPSSERESPVMASPTAAAAAAMFHGQQHGTFPRRSAQQQQPPSRYTVQRSFTPSSASSIPSTPSVSTPLLPASVSPAAYNTHYVQHQHDARGAVAGAAYRPSNPVHLLQHQQQQQHFLRSSAAVSATASPRSAAAAFEGGVCYSPQVCWSSTVSPSAYFRQQQHAQMHHQHQGRNSSNAETPRTHVDLSAMAAPAASSPSPRAVPGARRIVAAAAAPASAGPWPEDAADGGGGGGGASSHYSASRGAMPFQQRFQQQQQQLSALVNRFGAEQHDDDDDASDYADTDPVAGAAAAADFGGVAPSTPPQQAQLREGSLFDPRTNMSAACFTPRSVAVKTTVMRYAPVQPPLPTARAAGEDDDEDDDECDDVAPAASAAVSSQYSAEAAAAERRRRAAFEEALRIKRAAIQEQAAQLAAQAAAETAQRDRAVTHAANKVAALRMREHDVARRLDDKENDPEIFVLSAELRTVLRALSAMNLSARPPSLDAFVSLVR